MTLYFAYGSNLNRAAMMRRCPAARGVGTAVLEDYRFFVGVDGWLGETERRPPCLRRAVAADAA
jgi:hypothetical protein